MKAEIRERFARVWLGSATCAEAAAALGLSPTTVRVYASLLRQSGVDLPRMGSQMGPTHPDAVRAARHAHDAPTTRAKAAQIYGVSLVQVLDAFASLYPQSRRQIL